jgi:hypothetical protein
MMITGLTLMALGAFIILCGIRSKPAPAEQIEPPTKSLGRVVGAAVVCGVGILIARRLGWRWSAAPVELAGTDGIVLCVRVRTDEHEQTAQQILAALGGELVAVHEIEIDKRLRLRTFR